MFKTRGMGGVKGRLNNVKKKQTIWFGRASLTTHSDTDVLHLFDIKIVMKIIMKDSESALPPSHRSGGLGRAQTLKWHALPPSHRSGGLEKRRPSNGMRYLLLGGGPSYTVGGR